MNKLFIFISFLLTLISFIITDNDINPKQLALLSFCEKQKSKDECNKYDDMCCWMEPKPGAQNDVIEIGEFTGEIEDCTGKYYFDKNSKELGYDKTHVCSSQSIKVGFGILLSLILL